VSPQQHPKARKRPNRSAVADAINRTFTAPRALDNISPPTTILDYLADIDNALMRIGRMLERIAVTAERASEDAR